MSIVILNGLLYMEEFIMKKVCAMAGTIFNPEKPKQSIKELKEAGIQGILFDFGLIVSPAGILADRVREEPKWKPNQTRKYYNAVISQFQEHEYLPSIARLPFVDVNLNEKCGYSCADLNRLAAQIDADCVKACEEMGCYDIIVQPLFAGLRQEELWEANKTFYLNLAAVCSSEDTKILLTNQCRSHNGHLIRGVCSDGETAAEWVDALNRACGMQRFGFCLDVGNCNICGQNMQRMAADLNRRIQAVILTENDGQNMARLLPFTNAYGRRSTMDWLSVIRGLRDILFDGYLVLETVDTTVAFSPLLQPYLMPVYKEILDYFDLQINIEKDLKKYDRIVLFGAGNMCRNYMKCYGRKYPPLFTCDNNPKLWDTEFEGLMVKNPEELKNLPEGSGVIICNIFYREIRTQLEQMGIFNIGYFNDEYMPSFYTDRLKRDTDDAEDVDYNEG